MPEPVDAMPPEPPRLKSEPIGVRILGEVDPATLTKEAFDASPNLLYHGSAKQFTYKQAFDYGDEEYIADNDGSQTLGAGFYTTDLLSAAENYSKERQGRNIDAYPFVTRVLPYEARVLDLRASKDIGHNASLPSEIFNKWFDHYRDYYHKPGRENLPWYISEVENEYMEILNKAKALIDTGELLDLRNILGTGSSAKLRTRNWSSPCYMKLFADFMMQQGFDGLVYIEGGEGPKREIHPSFVFYNLAKVGTFETWQEHARQAIESPAGSAV